MNSINIKKYEEKVQIESQVDYWNAELNKFPAYPTGLVPHEIRKTKEYQFANTNFKIWFEKLRKFNSNLSNKEKKVFADYNRTFNVSQSLVYKTNDKQL